MRTHHYNTYLPIEKSREGNLFFGGSLKKPHEDKVADPVEEDMKEAEKPIVKKILEIFKNMKFPVKKPYKDKTRQNILKEDVEEIEAFVLGKVRAYDKPHLVDSVKNIKFPHLKELLEKLVKTHNPHFKYTSIQINKSVGTDWHFDRGNRGLSYLLAIGNYTGGGVVVKLPNGKEKLYRNKNKWILMDGHRLEHKSEGHKGGDRYAIIYYTHY